MVWGLVLCASQRWTPTPLTVKLGHLQGATRSEAKCEAWLEILAGLGMVWGGCLRGQSFKQASMMTGYLLGVLYPAVVSPTRPTEPRMFQQRREECVGQAL